jgi:hypothetical protein
MKSENLHEEQRRSFSFMNWFESRLSTVIMALCDAISLLDEKQKSSAVGYHLQQALFDAVRAYLASLTGKRPPSQRAWMQGDRRSRKRIEAAREATGRLFFNPSSCLQWLESFEEEDEE